MICDRCMKNYSSVKITKYGGRYLCDACLGEELSSSNKKSNGVLNYVKKLFGKKK